MVRRSLEVIVEEEAHPLEERMKEQLVNIVDMVNFCRRSKSRPAMRYATAESSTEHTNANNQR